LTFDRRAQVPAEQPALDGARVVWTIEADGASPPGPVRVVVYQRPLAG
jgi:hypothetical protein